MAETRMRSADVVIEVTPGFDGGYFKATFSGSEYVKANGDLDLSGFPGPVRVQMTLAKTTSAAEQWKWLKRGQFNVFSFSDDEAGDVILIGNGHAQINSVRVSARTLTFVYENLNRLSGLKRLKSRYNMYLTRGTEENIIYVIDPIIRNGGQRYL